MANNSDKQYTLPVFLKVHGERCIVIGGGSIALRKINELLDAGADVEVIAEEPSQDIRRINEDGTIKLQKRRFLEGDVEGAFIVIAATDEPETNVAVSEAAKSRGILVNIVDKPALCNFYTGAVVKRGPLRIAISTSGCSPSFAGSVRRDLEKLYTEEYGVFLEHAGEWRQKILSLPDIDEETKKEALTLLSIKDTFILFQQYGKDRIWEELEKIIFSS